MYTMNAIFLHFDMFDSLLFLALLLIVSIEILFWDNYFAWQIILLAVCTTSLCFVVKIKFICGNIFFSHEYCVEPIKRWIIKVETEEMEVI